MVFAWRIAKGKARREVSTYCMCVGERGDKNRDELAVANEFQGFLHAKKALPDWELRGDLVKRRNRLVPNPCYHRRMLEYSDPRRLRPDLSRIEKLL